MENSIKFHYASDVGAVGEYNTTIKEYKGNRFKLRYNSYSNLKGLCLNNKHNGNSTEEQLERYRQKRLFQRREMIHKRMALTVKVLRGSFWRTSPLWLLTEKKI